MSKDVGPYSDEVIESLLAEKKKYQAEGKKERVAAVDEQLKIGGYDPKKHGRADEPPAGAKSPAGSSNTAATTRTTSRSKPKEAPAATTTAAAGDGSGAQAAN